MPISWIQNASTVPSGTTVKSAPCQPIRSPIEWERLGQQSTLLAVARLIAPGYDAPSDLDHPLEVQISSFTPSTAKRTMIRFFRLPDLSNIARDAVHSAPAPPLGRIEWMTTQIRLRAHRAVWDARRRLALKVFPGFTYDDETDSDWEAEPWATR